MQSNQKARDKHDPAVSIFKIVSNLSPPVAIIPNLQQHDVLNTLLAFRCCAGGYVVQEHAMVRKFRAS